MWISSFAPRTPTRLTFKKTGTARQMMKSFTENIRFPSWLPHRESSTAPKRHTFWIGDVRCEKDEYYEEEPYRDIEVVDRIGSGDAYISGALYGLLAGDGDCMKAVQFGNATSAVKIRFPAICRHRTWKKSKPLSRPITRRGRRVRWQGSCQSYFRGFGVVRK